MADVALFVKRYLDSRLHGNDVPIFLIKAISQAS